MSSSSSAASYALPNTSQVGPRDAVQVAIFFRLDTNNKALVQTCQKHLEQSLSRLRPGLPYLYHRLRQDGNGVVRVEPVPGSNKVYCVTLDNKVTKAINYDSAVVTFFPPNNIPWDQLSIPSHSLAHGKTEPAAGLHILVLKGGLLVIPFIHHCIGDGTHMALFVNALAAATCQSEKDLVKDLPPMPTPELSYKKSNEARTLAGESDEFWRLLRQCPEYRYNAGGPQPCAFTEQMPANPPLNDLKSSEIFAIPKRYIKDLKATFSGTHERTKTTRPTPTYPPAQNSDPIPPTIARMIMPVDWTKKVADPPKAFGFYGIWAVTSIPYPTLLAASNPQCTPEERTTALQQVISAISTTISSINQSYVSKRLSLVHHASDTRVLGLAFDPRSKKDMIFNTWQHMGADSEWKLTPSGGDWEGVKPVFRKVNIPSPGSGLVLPTRKDAEELEVQLSIPKVSMPNLKRGELGRFVLGAQG
ncbi:hypothetical protein F5Y18DRAFT_439865 [Xylariaceae sp. FL1019]|nr:hypothetical protein F5Y18DRAFT_439865 [Xylariaceae sp. FL1019]